MLTSDGNLFAVKDNTNPLLCRITGEGSFCS